MQKFKQGDRAILLVGHKIWSNKEGDIDIMPELVGKEVIVQGSYNDLYGSGDTSKYDVIFAEDGAEIAWIPEEHLELINEHI